MSEINVRLASNNDSKDLIGLLHSEDPQHEKYTSQSIQDLLSNSSNRVFVAEDDDELCAVVISCVFDNGTSLVIKDVHIRDAYNEKEVVNELITGVYMYLGRNFTRLKTERFVTSSKKLSNIFEKHIKNIRTSHSISSKFTKVLQLDRLDLEIDASNEFSTKVDKMAGNSSVVQMKAKEADLYILRNLSCLSNLVMVVDSIPYTVHLSNIDTMFANGEYLIGEKQTNQTVQADHRRSSSQNITLSSGRNSPSRLHSSHMVNVLEHLHSSLKNMSGCLQRLKVSLYDALPKSFSHGKPVKSQQQNTWEAVVYCKDSGVFRCHLVEQLRAALLHFKTNFKLSVVYHSAMSDEAMKLFTEDLGLQLTYHETKKVGVYERPFQFSTQNSVLKVEDCHLRQ